MQKMNVKILVTFLKEGSSYVAYSPALDFSSCGKTMKAAEKNFAEAVDLFFEELQKKGTLDEVLIGLGWNKVKSKWRSPVPVAQRMTELCVPA
jgi:predicted RNase H-like HicB family nuclease